MVLKKKPEPAAVPLMGCGPPKDDRTPWSDSVPDTEWPRL